MTQPDYDPFGEKQKSPAMSFKDQPIGTVHAIDVSEPAKVLQQHNFDSGELDFWVNNDGSKTPKMAGVLNGTDEDGLPISLWAPIPSDLQAKLVDAQKALGRQIGGGTTIDRVHVKLSDRVPAKNPKYNKSVYAVKIEPLGPKPVKAPVEADPWASTPAEPAAAGFDEEPPW